MSSQRINETITYTRTKISQVPEYSIPDRIETANDVANVLSKSLHNIASCIPVSFAEPIARIFLEATKIADNTLENKKQCNELRKLVLGALENLEKSLASGIKPGIDFGKINMENYLQILTNITEYMNKLANPTTLKKIWRLITSEQVARKMQQLAKELNDMTQSLILSLVINIAARPPPLPIPEQKMWEITSLLNGAQASKSLMMQFTKSVNDIQEDRSQKRIVRGSRKHVIKKILKATREDVAEKEAKFDPRDGETERQFWSLVAIADYLKDCKYILKFRGIIERNGKRYTIFEWAKYGDLQTFLLTQPNLPWSFKIKIAWEIASALSHCHEKGILHHDVRSHNVMLGENYITQLTNFETSRPQVGSISWPVKDVNEVLRWNAPEKSSPEIRYAVENDVYSFGILMWEIASQKRPFADTESGMEVFDKVSNRERPDINLINIPEAFRTYVDEYLGIMYEAWHQEPSQRPEMTILCERLRNLYSKYNANEGEDDFSNLSMNLNNLEIQDTTNDKPTSWENDEKNKSADDLSLEKAEKYHDAKNYAAAWEIYDTLARSGNSEAKYKASYYLIRGPPFCPNKDSAKAENYIREAADDYHVEAQYRYYQLLLKKANAYLKYAVGQNHSNALYDYGEHLFKGTFERSDPEKGEEMLMAAHYRMNGKALKRLNELKAADSNRDKSI